MKTSHFHGVQRNCDLLDVRESGGSDLRANDGGYFVFNGERWQVAAG